MPNPIPQVVVLTEELADKILSALEDNTDVGSAAAAFFRERKSALIGLAVDPVVEILRNFGSGTKDEEATAQRAFVRTLPTAALVNAFYAESVEALESSTEPPMRIGGFLKALAQVGAKVAPRLLRVLTSIAGI